MASNTRGQSKATEQSNPASDTATISAQLTQLTAMMTAMTTRMEAFEARFSRSRPSTATQATLQATQLATHQSTPPAPERQSAQPITKSITQKEKEQEPQPLHQATVEDNTVDIAESTTEKKIEKHDMATSKPDSDSTFSTIPRLCATSISRDLTACLSDTLFFACQHVAFLACLRHDFPLGYIECSEGMEATGQG